MWFKYKSFLVRLKYHFRTKYVSSETYCQDRAKFIESERKLILGSKICLSEREALANRLLMCHKCEEFDDGFKYPEKFLAAQHFFKAKPRIEKSEVFKIIRKLPKGGSLHCHDLALTSDAYLLSLTYKPNLYCRMCDGVLLLKFFRKDAEKDPDWKLVCQLRASKLDFDECLMTHLSLVLEDPHNCYPHVNSVWTAFMHRFMTVQDLICYKAIFSEYFYQALKELYEDNVKYLEFRTILPKVYDLQGNTYEDLGVVGLYYKAFKKFKCDYPDFFGCKMIYAPLRLVDEATADKYVENIMKMKKHYPDFIAGIDLVGQEDLGKPLIDFIPQFISLRDRGVKFFFHAGETNWYGTPTDQNLFDAVLLNTTRIGHGFALVKHPKIAEEVKRKNIAIEISPISNQVLKLVDDMRNHPGNILIANNFPVVITCDDPSFWGAKALSYDWYMAFMGMTSRDTDLRFLKQLAINSLVYSGMEENEKKSALEKWENDWDKFIEDLLVENNIA